MIHLSNTQTPSEHVRNRAKNTWVRTLAPDLYLVKPKEKGKARRAVRILSSGSGVYFECSDKATGKPCPANSFGKECGHVEAVINRILINEKRRANKQLKQATATVITKP